MRMTSTEMLAAKMISVFVSMCLSHLMSPVLYLTTDPPPPLPLLPRPLLSSWLRKHLQHGWFWYEWRTEKNRKMLLSSLAPAAFNMSEGQRKIVKCYCQAWLQLVSAQISKIQFRNERSIAEVIISVHPPHCIVWGNNWMWELDNLDFFSVINV